MKSRPWLQVLSLVASVVVVVFAITFWHPVVLLAGSISLVYASVND